MSAHERRETVMGPPDRSPSSCRTKAQPLRMHRGHYEANQSRSRVVSAPGRDHEPHEHASEGAGNPASMTIDARFTVAIDTGDHQSALLFVHFLTPAHPAERGQT
jgi:hypothetical protein